MKTLSRTVLTLFVLSFSCLAAIAGEVSFKITKQYLNFPISHKENRGRMTFEVNGKPDLSVVIRLAPDEAEYWVFKDVSAFKGKTIKITYDGNEKGLSKIYQSDEIEGQAELYKEKNRPQFHFTTRRGWINDPNGLIYYEGEYHRKRLGEYALGPCGQQGPDTLDRITGRSVSRPFRNDVLRFGSHRL